MIEPDSVNYISRFIFDYFPIIISIGALVISIGIFLVKQRSEEFRMALDIHDKLEQKVNELMQVYADKQKKRDKSLEYLNIMEYYAFLVNNKEIKNKNIKKYFKPSLTVDVETIFKDLPDIAQDGKAYEETKKLLKKF